MITMQKVVCPITMVQSDGVSWCAGLLRKKELSAIPVMIPGSAIGRITTNETTSRPKNEKRWIANAAAEPSRIAATIVTPATLSESTKAWRTSWLAQAARNQCVVKPAIGQLCTFDLLNA